MTPAGRLASGHRRYGEAELKRLRFFRRAKSLGFSLQDIRSLLSLSDECNVANVNRAVQAKLAAIAMSLSSVSVVGNGLRLRKSSLQSE